MKKTMYVAAILAVSVFAQAESVQNSTLATSLTPILSTMSTVCNGDLENCRQIGEAKDDAAEFLATKGQIRSAKLQNALNLVREANASLQASDLQIAEAILALE